MKYLNLITLYLLVCAGSATIANDADTVFYEYWDINSLSSIGGYEVTKYGNPSVVETEKGQAVFFDGVDDALFINNNPFGDAKEFTFEVLFKPSGGEPNITSEPRFVCFWDPDDANGPRMTIEIRVTASGEWYFDGFLKTDKESLTLIDDTKTHPADQWMHAAVTYKDNHFTTFVNGQQELSGTVGYTSKIFNTSGKTSVGARYNLARWYNGAIRAIKVTHAAITPEEFFSVDDTTTNSFEEILPGADDMEIYPVPAHREINIRDINKDEIPLSVAITDMTGLKVYQSNLKADDSNATYKIDVSHLPEGVYFIILEYPDYSVTHKISILH
ncbi:MAG: T9SS type A sorting domain-containing protein [Bacteroidales bacterium]|nr:T9SS type A sorting domain-containing protein [Bacteroidales bacterium]